MTEIEHLKVNARSCPIADVIITNCGELVRKRKKEVSSSESESSDRYVNFAATLDASNMKFFFSARRKRERRSTRKSEALASKKRRTKGMHWRWE